MSISGITVVLPIENKMSDPEAMTAPFGIVNVGLTLLSTFYFAIAFFGYLRFGSESLGSITLNLPHDSLYGRDGIENKLNSKSVFDFLTYSRETWFSFSH